MAETFALVTGASSGIGRAAALRLSAGHNLLLHGRDAARLAETAQACAAATQHRTWQCDFGDAEQTGRSLTDCLQSRDIAIDVLVHCAGVATVLPMRAIEPHAVRAAMNVNVFSAMEIVRVLLQKKINHGALKSIVLVSSTHGIRGAAGYSLYAATKGALDAYVRALAAELAPAVRVNAVVPGAVVTPMAAKALEDAAFAEKLRKSYPLDIGAADDVAAAIAFLVSDDARWITGQQLVVDGGRTVL